MDLGSFGFLEEDDLQGAPGKRGSYAGHPPSIDQSGAVAHQEYEVAVLVVLAIGGVMAVPHTEAADDVMVPHGADGVVHDDLVGDAEPPTTAPEPQAHVVVNVVNEELWAKAADVIELSLIHISEPT